MSCLRSRLNHWRILLRAREVRSGTDACILAVGKMLDSAEKAAEQLEAIYSQPLARSYILTSAWHVPLRWFAAFDPADVVVESVVLNDTGAVPRGWNYVDRNGDGVLDLRLRYKLKDVPLVCGQQTLAVSAMTLAGDTVGGELKLEVTGCVF